MREWLIHLTPSAYHHDVQKLYGRIRNIWMAYLRGQIVLMLIVGIVFTIAWMIIGIPGALVLGVLAGLFTLIPDVGPFFAVALAFFVALLEGSSWIPLSNIWVAGIVLIVYLVLINLKNLFLRPIIMGRSVQMNEALVFISILIATILEGILGALLVVPVLASVIVILEYLRRRVLGLPPFAESENQQFIIPPQKVTSKRRINPSNKRKMKKS
jgi:predicted PurR-regulated permease PerM